MVESQSMAEFRSPEFSTMTIKVKKRMASPHQINMGLYFNKSVVPFGISVKKCWSVANSARSSEKRFTPYNERENLKSLKVDKLAR